MERLTESSMKKKVWKASDYINYKSTVVSVGWCIWWLHFGQCNYWQACSSFAYHQDYRSILSNQRQASIWWYGEDRLAKNLHLTPPKNNNLILTFTAIEVKSYGTGKHESIKEFKKKFSQHIKDSYILSQKDVSKEEDLKFLPLYFTPVVVKQLN